MSKGTTYHRSDLQRETLLVKCACRQIVHVPARGCECLCGRRHIRRAELPGKVRQKIIEGEG